jgi:protein-disulfide isomerase
VDISRRNLLIGTATVVIAAAAGGGYYAWSQSRPPATPAPAGPGVTLASTSDAELLAPGPLGEQEVGSANAPVTIIEYASMTCPHCAQFHEQVFPEIKKNFIDTGKVRFIFREFPLDPLAAAGFMLARCGDKDKYFPMIETLFAQQKDWVVQKPLAPLLAIAKQAGFTQESFDKCLANQKVLDGIEEVRTRAAQKFQVTSTPTFFVNGKMLRGSPTLEELTKQIEANLKG